MSDFEYKVRIEKTKKRIEVNDDGEFIEFDIRNSDFFEIFEKLQSIFEKNEISKAPAQIEKIFGDGACKKIFGIENPSAIALAEFFMQIFPILEENILKISKKFEKLQTAVQTRAKVRISERE